MSTTITSTGLSEKNRTQIDVPGTIPRYSVQLHFRGHGVTRLERPRADATAMRRSWQRIAAQEYSHGPLQATTAKQQWASVDSGGKNVLACAHTTHALGRRPDVHKCSYTHVILRVVEGVFGKHVEFEVIVSTIASTHHAWVSQAGREFVD